MCNAGESFISQRLAWATRYTFTIRKKGTNVAGHIPAD
jgi:hypothetical protein